MKGEVFCFCLAGSLVSAVTARAVPDAIPYQQIPERNVFGLKAAAAPVQTNVITPSIPKLIPQGVTTVLGNRLAIFKAQYPAKAPDPAKEVTMMLAEGQSEGGVEVLQIDVNAGAIRFNNQGTVMTMTLDKDGAKLPATPVAAPAQAGVNAIPAPQFTTTQPAPNGILYPTNTSLKTIPSRQMPVPAAPLPGQTTISNPPPLTPEEQAVLLEVERERTKTQVQNGSLPPLPPTPLTPRPQ